MGKIKDILFHLLSTILSLFFMVTNGVASYFCVSVIYNFVPKVIHYYKLDDNTFLLYGGIILVITILLYTFIKHFIYAVKTIILIFSLPFK